MAQRMNYLLRFLLLLPARKRRQLSFGKHFAIVYSSCAGTNMTTLAIATYADSSASQCEALRDDKDTHDDGAG